MKVLSADDSSAPIAVTLAMKKSAQLVMINVDMLYFMSLALQFLSQRMNRCKYLVKRSLKICKIFC
jgi:hypothetical protein